MSNVEVLEENNETTAPKKPKLRVIRGGKGPPEGPSTDWLGELPCGTTFVARVNSNYVDYELYHVVFKTEDAVLLKWELPDGKFWDRFVNSKEFSKRYTEHVLLGIQQEETNGNGNRTDRQCDVVLHEAVPGVDQVVSVAEEPNLPDGD